MASIRKRTFGKNKDEEVWIVDYYDQHKKRHIKTFPNKKAAEAWKVGAQHEISQGTHTPASTSLTVAEVWAKWLKECEAELEFGTVRERRNHFKHHVAEFLGNVRLSSLTQPVVYEFDSALRNAGRSWAMRRKVLTSLKTCLAFAQGRGYAAQNVARGVRIKKENREGGGPLRAGVDFPTMPELNTLIDNAQRRWRPFIVTAIFSGMRMSELRGLCWGNVDLDTATIHVRQRADGWNQIGPPKSDAGARDIPLPPLVVNTLRQWKLQCRSNEFVFPTVTGKIMRPSTVDKCWRQLLQKCGLPAYGFYMLRHGAASLFIKHLKWTLKKTERYGS